MFAVRLFQYSVATVEAFVASLLGVHAAICVEHFFNVWTNDMSVWVQGYGYYTCNPAEVLPVCLAIAAAFMLLAHAFKLIVYEKF